MIKLKSKPSNAVLKGDGTSIFAELEGQPITGINFDYFNFCRRDPLFDDMAGGDATFYMKNGNTWVFEVRGIDVQHVVTLRRELGKLYDAIPMNCHSAVNFMWKSCLNAHGKVRHYCATTVDFSVVSYDLAKSFDIIIKTEDNSHSTYILICDK